MSTDPIMAEIQAAAASQATDRAGARARLEAIWPRIEGGAPMHVMALAHTLADLQDDPAEELAWDLKSLDAARAGTDADVRAGSPMTSIAAFMPSIHCNLAEDYFKLGDLERSREHLSLAQANVDALADDAYGKLIRGGIERMVKRVGAGSA